MAKAPRYSEEARNEKANALAMLLDDGYLRIYSGIRPNGPDDAVTQNDPTAILLAELRFADPAAAGPADAGLVTFDDIVADDDANASGTAAWFRALKADGTSAILDGTVGAAGLFDIVFDSVVITAGARVEVTGLTYTEPAS